MSNAPLVAAATGSQQARVAATAAANNPRGVSTLLYACQQGDVDRVRRILRAQPNALSERDRTGKTALHYCCTSDHISAAQAADVLVMAAPDLVESRDEDGFTPLHLAVIAGNMPLVTFLLANNADVNAVDNEKHTVVHWATVCGETVALRAVLAAGAPVSTPDVHGGYPLHYAAQMCGGEKDSALGLQVLHTLLSHQDISVSVEDGDGRQPLLWAASAGSAKAVLALIRAGAAVESHDKDGLTALHCSASRGHTDCIDTLLTLCGASPDVIDSNGCTALHYAVTLGHADATALLLAHAADPNRQDRKGRSPAHCGCAKGQFETVKMLGTHGANLWLRNARGDLPLHEAAASGRRDLVKWLLEARPSQVNARNNDGRCPLHLAALNDNADMCKILLDAGAQVNPVLRTSKNLFMTPLDCALQRGFRATAKYLQLHGGVPANRLTGVPQVQGVGSAVSLQIRDDVTLWGDSSSESEKEEVGRKSKSKKKTYKRKLAYKYERKKVPISASEYESEKLTSGKLESEETLKAKKSEKSKNANIDQKDGVNHHPDFPFLGNNIPHGEIFIYANEVNINEKFGGLRAQQNGEVTVGDSSKIVKSTDQIKTTAVQTGASLKSSASSLSDKQEKRPRSAKYGRLKNKSGKQSTKADNAKSKTDTDIPYPRRKQTDEEILSSYENGIVDEDTVEIKDDKKEARPTTKKDVSSKTSEAKQVLEDKAAMPTTEKLPSKPLQKEDAAFIETAIPRTTEKPRIIHPDQQSARSNTSYEDGEDHKQLVVEASIHSPPKEVSEGVVSPKTTTEVPSKTTLEVSGLPQERRSTPVGSETLPDDSTRRTNAADVDEKISEGEKEKDVADSMMAPAAIEKTPEEVAELKETSSLTAKPSPAVAEPTTTATGETVIAIGKPPTSKEAEIKVGETDAQEKDGTSRDIKSEIDVAESSTTHTVTTDAPTITGVSTATAPSTEVPATTATLSEKEEKLQLQIDKDLLTKEKIALKSETTEQPQEYFVAPISQEELKTTADEASSTPVTTPAEIKTPAVEQRAPKMKEKGLEQRKDLQQEETVEEKESLGQKGKSSLSGAAKSDLKPAEKNLEEPKESVILSSTLSVGQDLAKNQETKYKETVKIKKEKHPKQHIEVESDSSNEAIDSGQRVKETAVTETEAQQKRISARKKRKKPQEYSEEPTVVSSSSHQVVEVPNDHQIIRTSISPKTVKSPRDSSIDAKSSEESEKEEEETSPSSSSPSSTVSVTRKEHKSFKVLDDNLCQEGLKKTQQRKSVRQRSPPKKQRSQSEGSKTVKIAGQGTYKEHEPLRRSKIPTPVMNLKTPLSKSDRHLERRERKALSGIEPRVPSLPNIRDSKEMGLRHSRSISNLSAPLVSTYSDNDQETGSDGGEIISSATRKKRLRKRSKTRSTKSAGSDYESSNLIDSGFEPSPRSSRIPKWKNMSERGVNMTSVTQTIQSNIRRYHLERKIFQHLLDLKRLQIRSGQHNEAVLVKRAIDAYHRSCAATVGAGRYTSQDYSFKSFEHFLYNSLRKIQRNGIEHMQGLPEAPRNPLFCTQKTHRCDHATHAYTGVPCAAYLPKMDHHTIPKIGFDCKPSGFLPKINPKNTVTLELCHGNDKQVISLPAERLDQNKRYYVTFTVKGNENGSTALSEEINAHKFSAGHRHSKSD